MIGVFGANGFLGRHLTRRLVAEQRDVVAVARRWDPPAEPVEPRVTVTADLRDHEAIARSLEGVETVVQLMGSSTPAEGNSRTVEDIEDNVIPHVRFLNQCVGAGVRRIVFLSSGGTVYGPVAANPVPETAPTNPISSYGVTKLMVEKFVQLHSRLDGLEHVILRVGNPYGPGQVFRNGQGLVPALLDRYREGLPVTILGDGSAGRDYVYIDDVTDALVGAIDLRGPAGHTLNIGTGECRTVLDVVRAIEEVGEMKFQVMFAPARASDVESISLDNELAGQVLGWRPRTCFRDGLALTIRS